MITSKEISVVIQGAVSKKTVILIRSIRKYLPEAEIVVSTWKKSKADGLDIDKLVLNEDPGALSAVIDKKRVFNINRQIVSSIAGIRAATRPYILKCRSDMELLGTDFLTFWDKYPKRDPEYTIAEHKIIIPSLYTIKGEFLGDKFHPTPFHISDWYAFGTRNDMIKLFDIPVVEIQDFARYFVNHPRPKEYHYPMVDERYWKFPPEQYLGVCYAKKWKSDLDFPNFLNYENIDFEAAERFIINNFTVVEQAEGQIILNKDSYYNMSQNSSFYPEYIKSTAYRRCVYEADYQKYCEPEFIPQKDELIPLIEKQYICNVQEEYQKLNKKEPEEFDFGIITPTYRNHFMFIPAYLDSFCRYVTDKEKVPIYFLVSGDEYYDFCNLIRPHAEGLRVHVLTFEALLEFFGVQDTPDHLLKKFGRFSFQTLKKFYTMLYAKKSRYLVLDSESVWIAPTSMEAEFETYFKAPFVPYSPLTLRGEKKLGCNATENVEHLLNHVTDIWCLEGFSWFYERHILEEMLEELGGPLKAVQSVYEFDKKNKRFLGLMEIILYTVYLEKCYGDQYEFVNVYDKFQSALNSKEFHTYIQNIEAFYLGESGVAEHMLQFLSWENWKPLAALYKEKHFNIIRCETNSDESYVLQKKFLKAADTKILAASQNHRFLPNPTTSAARPERGRTGKKLTLPGILYHLRTLIKRLMMRILPAYRVAVDTRFKLESFIGETNGNFDHTRREFSDWIGKMEYTVPRAFNELRVRQMLDVYDWLMEVMGDYDIKGRRICIADEDCGDWGSLFLTYGASVDFICHDKERRDFFRERFPSCLVVKSLKNITKSTEYDIIINFGQLHGGLDWLDADNRRWSAEYLVNITDAAQSLEKDDDETGEEKGIMRTGVMYKKVEEKEFPQLIANGRNVSFTVYSAQTNQSAD